VIAALTEGSHSIRSPDDLPRWRSGVFDRAVVLGRRGEQQLAALCQRWLDRARERLSAAAPARSSDES
jgi:hypothetical protein